MNKTTTVVTDKEICEHQMCNIFLFQAMISIDLINDWCVSAPFLLHRVTTMMTASSRRISWQTTIMPTSQQPTLACTLASARPAKQREATGSHPPWPWHTSFQGYEFEDQNPAEQSQGHCYRLDLLIFFFYYNGPLWKTAFLIFSPKESISVGNVCMNCYHAK